MNKPRLKEYSIIINAMVNDNMHFNQEIAKETYGWEQHAFYCFTNFIKNLDHLKCFKENNNYYLSLKGDEKSSR